MRKHNGMTLHKQSGPDFVRLSSDDPYKNVEQIRAAGMRVIRGTVPASVRKELAYAVKVGWLGRLRKNGMGPEIFFHPCHANGAIERQRQEMECSLEAITKVCV